MLIIADENIPAVEEAFAPFGEVITKHGRQLTADDVRDAEVLLVRSITRVDKKLLSGSKVKFVGSATIGTDHVDIEWLASQGITFVNAPGCNAVSAAEYVMSALFTVSQQYSINLPGKTVGIVGGGNVGSRVKARMQAIGLQCIVCDPPRAEKEGDAGFVSMQEIASADIVTMHVPLVKQGPHKTRNLVDQQFVESLPANSLFINTSRGDVVDEAALKGKLATDKGSHAILDVWNNEPVIDRALVDLVDIATPHIAGYSIDGKLRATQVLHDAVSQFLGRDVSWDASPLLAEPSRPLIDMHSSVDSDLITKIQHCMRHVYDVTLDDGALRESLTLRENERGQAFDLLRKNYQPRRECSAYRCNEKTDNNEYNTALAAFGLA